MSDELKQTIINKINSNDIILVHERYKKYAYVWIFSNCCQGIINV